jgi:GH24 family phage-related lysozyme (muramidase)
MRARLKVSRAGVELIKSFEGLRQTATRLPDGRWTLGYGHTFSAREGARVTQEDADALLRFDLLPIVDAINNLVVVPLNQNQFDALVSFCFNIGVENFTASTVLKRINEGRMNEAAQAMDAWRSAEFNGQTYVLAPLIRRRAAEKSLFQTPDSVDPALGMTVRPVEDASAQLAPETPAPARQVIDLNAAADVARQQALASEREAAERQELLRQEALRQETLRQETLRQEAIRQAEAVAEARRAEEARLREEALRRERDRLEAEQRAREQAERERLERERLAQEAAARMEAARLDAERRERERAEAARLEALRLEAARQDAERRERERQEAVRREAERLNAENRAREQAALEQAAKEKAAEEKARREAAERLEAAERHETAAAEPASAIEDEAEKARKAEAASALMRLYSPYGGSLGRPLTAPKPVAAGIESLSQPAPLTPAASQTAPIDIRADQDEAETPQSEPKSEPESEPKSGPEPEPEAETTPEPASDTVSPGSVSSASVASEPAALVFQTAAQTPPPVITALNPYARPLTPPPAPQAAPQAQPEAQAEIVEVARPAAVNLATESPLNWREQLQRPLPQDHEPVAAVSAPHLASDLMTARGASHFDEDYGDDEGWTLDGGRVAVSNEDEAPEHASLWTMIVSTFWWIIISTIGLGCLGVAAGAYYKSKDLTVIRNGAFGDYMTWSIVMAAIGILCVSISVWLIMRRLGGLKD